METVTKTSHTYLGVNKNKTYAEHVSESTGNIPVMFLSFSYWEASTCIDKSLFEWDRMVPHRSHLWSNNWCWRISTLVGLIVLEIWAFKDTQLVGNCSKIGAFSVKMHFSVALVSLTRLIWHSNAFPIEAPLIPFKMVVSVLFDGNLGSWVPSFETYGKFKRL
jgi:hypothetical protein